MKNDGKTRKMPKGKEFSSEYQPESNGRPKGSVSLETRVRRLLEGDERLPAAIEATIKKAVGEDKKALDAMIIVGLLQALQGDKGWAQLIWEQGWGKAAQKVDLTSKGEALKGTTIVVGSQADKDLLEKL